MPLNAKHSMERPLSPHLQIYRWSWTMAMSIMHRLTGMALYGAYGLFACGSALAVFGPSAFAHLLEGFPRWILNTVYVLLIWVLMHHLWGGVRHFVWDCGIGFSKNTRTLMAAGTLVLSMCSTLAYVFFF